MDALQPLDPRQVGRYRLLQRLGTGGMGRVFLGQSPGGRLVAVKLIRAELADDPDFRRRFAQEVSAARRVGGIFTAPVVDADPDGPQPWLVTAYVAGPSLTDAVTAQGPMPAESVRTLAAGLAEGLGAVHGAGVVHRDLKPSNVLLASDGPRIIDFGISRATDSTWLTNAGGVVGSPGFMSPEQAEGGQVGPPTDIFSLGGVLAFAATGQPPFGAGSASALLYRVVYGTAATGNVPAELRHLVEWCLAKDPADRPSTDQLLDYLGYAEPAGSWSSWHAAPSRPALPLPDTCNDQSQEGNALIPPCTFAHLAAGASEGEPAEPGWPPAPDSGRAPGSGRAGAARRAGRSRVHVLRRPHRRTGPAKGGGSTALIGAAAVIALGLGATAAVTLAELLPNEAGGAGGALPGQLAVSPGTGSPAAAGPAGPRTVVAAYFAAINGRNWLKVWQLGGEHLNLSYEGMVDGYASTARDEVRSVTVSGDHATVRVRAYETSGIQQEYQMDFVIENGEIVHARQRLLGSGS